MYNQVQSQGQVGKNDKEKLMFMHVSVFWQVV